MIAYRPATLDDAPAIDALFRRSFSDTFGHLYDPGDLALFFEDLTDATWRAQIADPDFAFRLAEQDGALAGYAKLSSVSLPLPVEPASPAVELDQLYVLRPWHGTGIAQALMEWTIAEARGRGASELYLSVFTDNHRARSFYARYGFEAIGPYIFMVGNHADDDIIMRAKL
jgi:GNAT superfamily N-acetyltransferase